MTGLRDSLIRPISCRTEPRSIAAASSDAAGAPRSNNPSILIALQEQLGCGRSTKGPVEVIVIDHVERPSAN
jgi:uncharacterized protein (TIGR03435 family)